MNRRVKKSVAVLIVALAVLVSGCAATSQSARDAINTLHDMSHAVDYLELTSSLTIVTENYTNFITGTIKNTSSKVIDYVEIDFAIFDKEGNQVGTTLANITNLQPGATWKFKAPILNRDAFEVQMLKIIAW